MNKMLILLSKLLGNMDQLEINLYNDEIYRILNNYLIQQEKELAI